ncbi:hypothetical protein BJF90_36105 [Pseudonocardia sp. CNS-004]|nr:hypothetical protein BJF90_36105 [Pseudonocardia sp. CNS-004]
MSSDVLLDVQDLRKEFHVRNAGRTARLTAIDGIDLEVRRGETVALVGESGSGKSTVARCIARLVEPTSGGAWLGGRALGGLRRRKLSRLYGKLQMVFQDPNSSLNPRMTVRAILDEPLVLHLRMSRADRETRVRELLEAVGLAAEHLDRWPHQLSGGQRQRVGIARALAVDPELILLDEPTASLDVSVRGQVIELLQQVQQERGIAYLFITHDLQVVQRIAHRVVVMYLGTIVEQGQTEQVFAHPTHPYTKALLTAAPTAEYGVRRERFRLSGEPPSPIDLPAGCRLAGRCPIAEERCRTDAPPLTVVERHHLVACPPMSGGWRRAAPAAPAGGPDAQTTPRLPHVAQEPGAPS